MRCLLPPLAALLLASSVHAQSRSPGAIRGAELARVERAARAATIVRDTWGVPHVHAPTDAGVAVGIGFAQAEDNFWLLEEEYIRALGRTAEVYGDSMVDNDAARRAMGAAAEARARYARSAPAFRALMRGYVDGINLWIARHPGAPRLLPRFEPWWPFMFEGAGRFSAGTAPTLAAMGLAPRGRDTVSARVTGAPVAPPGEGLFPDEEPPEGSNAWAIAPARTASGRAMLFVNPHWQYFIASQRWEVHVESGQGWRFSGFCILGNPIPRSGHNDRLGWTHTNLAADYDDVWSVTFDHPTDSLAYRFAGGWRRAVPWTDTIRVKTDSGVATRVVRMLRTHHGAVFAWPDSTRALVVRTVGAELTASPLEQRYRMNKARTLAEWLRAMDMRTISGSNTTYADADGHILLAVGNAAPKRRPGRDGRGLLDGSDSTTGWLGLHPLSEIPMLLDPASGYVQNTNSSAWHATADGANLDSARFAPYLALDRENPRSRRSRQLLDSARNVTLDDLARMAMDRRIGIADEQLPPLLAEFDRLTSADAARAAALRPLVDSLRAWDRRSDTTSVATTLFVQAVREGRAARPVPADSFPRMTALERARDSLVAAHGRWTVPFGAVNRIQRVHPSGTWPFDARRPSWAIPNLDGSFGTIANATTTLAPSPALARDTTYARSTAARTRWGTAGHSYVAVIEFAPEVEARSLLHFGQSADSTSRHHVDQAPLYSRGEFKPAWYRRADVDAHAERRYHPGGRDLPLPRRVAERR